VLPRPRVALRIRRRVSLQSAARCKDYVSKYITKDLRNGISRITDGSAKPHGHKGTEFIQNRKGKLDMKPSRKRLLTVQDAATFLAVSTSTLYGWVYREGFRL